MFDSVYDDYRGVVLSVRIHEGIVRPGDRIRLMNSGSEYEVTEVGVNSPKPLARDYLMAGMLVTLRLASRIFRIPE